MALEAELFVTEACCLTVTAGVNASVVVVDEAGIRSVESLMVVSLSTVNKVENLTLCSHQPGQTSRSVEPPLFTSIRSPPAGNFDRFSG